MDQSVASNTEKEVLEEIGLTVHARRLIAAQDWRKHNVQNYPYGVLKIFVECEYECGEFAQNIETTETAFFDRDELPERLAVEKTTKEQILMCFDAHDNPLPCRCLTKKRTFYIYKIISKWLQARPKML